tara:strand:- start:15848 stop:16867 length:1020 start_codon:yes stop_codon:yes gene_type:complete
LNKSSREKYESSREPYRKQSLAKDIVFIDGMSGSGKSMIAPLMSSLNRGELWLLDHIFEYCLIMYSLGSMSESAAKTLINIYIDHDSYHLRIGRNVNLRASDDSSAQKNGLYELYKKRMEGPEGDSIIKLIASEKPINFFMSHYIFRESQPLFSALKDRLKLFIVPVRHPYWVIENWMNQDWDNKMGNSPKDLAMVYKYNGRVYPWHVKGWEDIYDQLNNFERAIETFKRLYISTDEVKENFTHNQQEKIMMISFEKFATDPHNYLNSINKHLNTEFTSDTESVMSSMNLPRKIEPTIFSLKKDEILKKANREKISSHHKDLLIHLADQYENEYLKDIL